MCLRAELVGTPSFCPRLKRKKAITNFTNLRYRVALGMENNSLLDHFRRIAITFSNTGLRMMWEEASAAVEAGLAADEADFVVWKQALQDELASRKG